MIHSGVQSVALGLLLTVILTRVLERVRRFRRRVKRNGRLVDSLKRKKRKSRQRLNARQPQQTWLANKLRYFGQLARSLSAKEAKRTYRALQVCDANRLWKKKKLRNVQRAAGQESVKAGRGRLPKAARTRPRLRRREG